ncbi:5'-methylthioadenosine/adenosylhomocysteine nucleosidase [Prevotella sp. tc2-28]|uniref:5'-methylthioadenosine/adenosylhomocysteine nucleosidase n=1 Tax=Prevotella sp. tc2-28 TaxID=1761888 RepID=UPI000AF4F443|nr:5'-methylthioadenosine/adenosylhomocysteine nucleosidase [Prevotella sp. tc2-28]
MRIGIIVAMDKELQQLLQLMKNSLECLQKGQTFWISQFGNNTLIVTKSGIGKVNAAYGVINLIDNYCPDVVISTGCAGGASTNLEIRDVVVSTQICYHDVWCGQPNELGQIQGLPAKYEADSKLVEIAKQLKCNTHIVPGLIVSGDWFVDSVDKMKPIVDAFPDALAVDMESAALAQICHLYKMPFLSFRVISDIPLKPNNEIDYNKFWSDVADESFGVTKEFVLSIINN